MSSRRKQDPPWARVVPADVTVPLEPPQEEAYLRTRAVHHLYRRLDEAVGEALEEGIRAVQTTLEGLLRKVDPAARDAVSPGEPTVEESKDSLTMDEDDETSCWTEFQADFVMDPPTRYDSRMLPILSIEGLSSRLDRSLWIQHLLLLRTDWHVVWLRQPDVAQLRAKCTRRNETTLVLMDCEADTAVWTWLSQTRAWEGIPLVVILLGQTTTQPASLSSVAQGPCGWLVEHCELPSPKHLLANICNQVWKNVVASPSVWQTILDTFYNLDRSIVLVIQRLKQILAHQMTVPGSFVTLRDAAVEKKRRNWFLTTDYAQRTLNLSTASDKTWNANLEECEWKVDTAQRVLETVFGDLDSVFCLLSSRELRGSSIEKKLDDDVRHRCLSLLAEIRAGVDDRMKKAYVDELIILTDACSFPHELFYCLDESCREWREHVETATRQSQTVEAMTSSLNAHARQSLVSALASEMTMPTIEGNWLYLVGKAYSAMNDRVSISQEDLFQSMLVYFPSGISDQDAFKLLIHAVDSLKLLGLIREKAIAGKGGTTYEKTAMVWCDDLTMAKNSTS